MANLAVNQTGLMGKNENVGNPEPRKISAATAPPRPVPPADPPAAQTIPSASQAAAVVTAQHDDNRNSRRVFWFIIAIFAVGFVIVLGLASAQNTLPAGYDSTDDVLTLAGETKKANEDIQTYSGYGQLAAGIAGRPDERPDAVIVMKNSGTGRFVFKYNNHPVYLIRVLTRQYDNGDYDYVTVGLGVTEDDSGTRYEKVLPKSFKDDNAEEGHSYDFDDYDTNYAVTDDD
ncbi:hypothetical protein [Schleiferilactobacillus shenzhenensis]|uniref:hypothetical protein n=1 Tax=Schleiferilactobacillus shenzhenensis TaxID=1231337 RepID=UPI0012DD9130|nr:hypothetical protein [Schleiferilactobacillus shenzhenensis]